MQPSTRRTITSALVLLAFTVPVACSRRQPDDQNKATNESTTNQNQDPKDYSSQAPGTTPADQSREAREASRDRSPTVRLRTAATLAPGTPFTGTLQTALASNQSQVGEPVVLRLTEPVEMNGRVVVPAGSLVNGRVTLVQPAGRIRGASELAVRFQDLELPNGQHLPAAFEPVRWFHKGSGKESAAEIGGGTAIGGILGGVMGGKQGAVKGGAVGAAVGTGVAVATKGKQVVVPVGYGLQIRLAEPVTL